MLLTPLQYQRMPWKNGGGSTDEIFAERKDTRMLWRVSLATISQSGPFSCFEDYTRVIVTLKGDVELSHSGARRFALESLVPYKFDGGLATECYLSGSDALDFNLMAHKNFGLPAVWAVRDSSQEIITKGLRRLAVYAFMGEALMEGNVDNTTINQGETLILGGDSVIKPPDDKFKVTASGIVLIAAIRRS